MRTRRVAAMAAAGTAVLGSVAIAAAPVTASQPGRSAWWNLAPFGLVVSPAPATASQLEVGEETGPSAVAALWFSVTNTEVPDPGSVTATLSVPYESGSSVGTPSVLVCPVSASASGWKAGGNQPATSAPAYDCSGTKAVTGQLASDSSAMTFRLGALQLDAKAMAFDIALVPTGTVPFQAVFDVPGPNGLVVQPPVTAPVSSSGAGAGVAPVTAGSGAGVAGGGTAAPPLPVGSSGSTFSGGSSLSAPVAPVAANPSGSGSGSGSGSSSAGSAAPASGRSRLASGKPTASRSAGSSSSGGWLGGRRQQLLGVWLMVDAALVLWLFASDPERPPRLLGSMAARRRDRGATATEQGGEIEDGPEVRGIGRFARARTGPPRALT